MALTKCRECGQTTSTQAYTCPHCGAPYPAPTSIPPPIPPPVIVQQASEKKKGMGFFSGCLLVIFIVFIIVFIIGVISKTVIQTVSPRGSAASVGRSASEPQPSSTEQLPQHKTNLLSFILLKDGSFERVGTAKVIWEILVPSEVTKKSLTNLLNALYSQAQSRKFKQHAGATVIDIKAYMSRQHAESGMGQWIGWMSKSGVESQPKLSLDDRQINQLGKIAEEKFGLSEAKRREICEDEDRAEVRASKEAEQTHPEPRPHNRDAYMAAFEKREKLEKQLLNEYRDALAKKHNISREQLTEIWHEGLQKSWPFPKR